MPYPITININDVLRTANRDLLLCPEVTDVISSDVSSLFDEKPFDCLAAKITTALYPLNKWIVNKYSLSSETLTFYVSVQPTNADLKNGIEKALTCGLLLEWMQTQNFEVSMNKYETLLNANLLFIASVSGAIKTSSIRQTLT